MKDDGFMPGIIIGVIIGFVGAMTLGVIAQNELKAEAIEVGAAEWLVEPKSGATTFTWKEKK